MTREQELKILKQFIDENGVTTLPPDERGREMIVFSAWGPNRKKKKRGKKKKNE